MINFDFDTYRKKFISDEEIEKYNKIIPNIKTFLDSDIEMKGWYDLEKLYDKELIDDIKTTAKYVRDNCDVFLIVAIGGAYSVSSAIIESLRPYYYNQTESPQIYYVSTSLSSEHYSNLIELIKDKRVIVNVISKSGTTFETMTFYHLIMDFMKNKYSFEELSKRVIITTDKEKGLLRQEVNRLGCKSFIVPDSIGDRYAPFTVTGLLPVAVANFDIDALFAGAKEISKNLDNQIKYAIIRHIMYQKGKIVEAFVVYEPKLYTFAEWLKQLYGESLGKEERGILPISIINVRDLHSMGQFMQQGHKILFETVINVQKSYANIYVEQYKKSLDDINNIAVVATSQAHQNGGVLNNVITLNELNEYNLGYLMQFFMTSCAISGCIDEVNPFNQEGVEDYKKIMQELLKK